MPDRVRHDGRTLDSQVIICVLFKGTTKTKILDRKDFKFEYLIEDGGPRKEIPEIPLEVLRNDTGTAPIKLEEIADAKYLACYIALH